MLKFITQHHIDEAVKFLVSGKDGQHMPYTDESGMPNHRLMGAAWAALHGGYRGNKYEGANKQAAIDKLKGVYKSEKMQTPMESYAMAGEFFEKSLRFDLSDVAKMDAGTMTSEEAMRKDDSFDAIRCAVMDAINANIRVGVDMDCDNDGPQDAIEGKCAWCQDIWPGVVVYSMDGELFQCDYTMGTDDTVTLGTPQPVEMTYTPEAEGADQESRRVLVVGSTPLQESAYNPSSGQLKLKVIEPGFNKSKARFYPASTLKRDFKVFEGAKMFADHQTEAESKARPEGSVNNWVANIKKVWVEKDGTVRADAVVIDPTFKSKLDKLNEQHLINEMGVSIRAVGEARKAEVDGIETNYVESLLAARSVDFVTFAGAGGQVEAMESDAQHDEFDVDLVSEAQFRTRRPDLVTLIESNARREAMKTLEQQLQEARQQNEQMTTKLAEADKKAAAAELGTLLLESKLPEPAQQRLRKQFAEAVSSDGMKEAITAEADYIKSVAPVASTTKKNMGDKDNGTHQEANGATKPNLKEAFALIPGMTEREAEFAANK